MQVAFLVDSFPSLSQTFVLDQITGLLDLGFDVKIYAESRAVGNPTHEAIDRYRLIERTSFYGRVQTHRSPRQRLESLAKRVILRGDLAAVRSLDPFALGRRVVTLRPFEIYEALATSGIGDADAVICHFGPIGNIGAALKAMRVIRSPLLVFFHGYDLTKVIQACGRNHYDRLFRHADFILPISERWRRELIELGCNPGKIQVHHMGVAPDRFAFRPRKTSTDRPIQILSVARLVEKKGIAYGIDAIRALSQKSGRSLSYRIVGDGPLLESLRARTADAGLADVVSFTGWQTTEQIQHHMDEADILLTPSVTASDGDQEGIPVVLMEAMSSGIPVVSTLHSGIPELVANDVSGLLVPERNPDALANALLRLIEDPRLGERLAIAARAAIERQFDNRVLNERLRTILESAAGGGVGRSD